MATPARCFVEVEPVELEHRLDLVPAKAAGCPDCEHTESHHCHGGQQHSNWRRGGATVCVGRHCMDPLCSCVDVDGKQAG